MIHSASFFQTQYHKGILIPISRTIPGRLKYELVRNHPLKRLCAPSRELLSWYKDKQDLAYTRGWGFPNHYIQRQYKEQYKEQIRPKLKPIKKHLQELAYTPQNYTLLCWEKRDEFCHRKLIMMCVWRWFETGCGDSN